VLVRKSARSLRHERVDGLNRLWVELPLRPAQPWPERVAQAVSVAPSGEAFHSISLEPGTGRPLNPVINTGAIALAGLIGAASTRSRQAVHGTG
jgi:hypothetical protein